MAKKKVLLMGKAHSGKTSMRSIIFANYLARDTTRLSPTLDVEHHHVRFLGDLVLNLWDCGGQDAFYESYFERDRETIFRSVELLIYVFDIESDSPEKDFDHFCGVLEAMEENSPDARIFVLIHKMDLVAEEDRESIFEDRKRLVEESCRSCCVQHYQCYATSIWNETLYRAWSEIVATLVPNINILETHLKNFCRACDADEVVLFERATFLVVSHAQTSAEDAVEWETMSQQGGGGTASATPGSFADAPTSAFSESDLQLIDGATGDNNEALTAATNHTDGIGSLNDPASTDGSSVVANSTPAAQPNGRLVQVPSSQQLQQATHRPRSTHFDAHRFEKISNIIKQFKLSCGKAQSQFQGMQVRNSRFRAFIDAFTDNTYIMVIVSNPHVHTAATLLNIQNARQHFERFIPRI